MKSFELELAKLGAPLITRKGLPARIVCFDRVDEKYKAPILALILGNDKKWEMTVQYNNEGRIPYGHNPDFDLFIDDQSDVWKKMIN